MVSNRPRLGKSPTSATAVILNNRQDGLAEGSKPFACTSRPNHTGAGYTRLGCAAFRAMSTAPAIVDFIEHSKILFSDKNRVATLVAFQTMATGGGFPAGDSVDSLIAELATLYQSNIKVREAEFAARVVHVQIEGIKDMLEVAALQVTGGVLSQIDQDRIVHLEDERQRVCLKLAGLSAENVSYVRRFSYPHAHRLLRDGDDDLETVNRVLVINDYIRRNVSVFHAD